MKPRDDGNKTTRPYYSFLRTTASVGIVLTAILGLGYSLGYNAKVDCIEQAKEEIREEIREFENRYKIKGPPSKSINPVGIWNAVYDDNSSEHSESPI